MGASLILGETIISDPTSRDASAFVVGLGAVFCFVGWGMWARGKRMSRGAPSERRQGAYTLKKVSILTVDDKAEAGLGRWYRLRHWRTDNFLMMGVTWPDEWKKFSDHEDVAGGSFEGRDKAFFKIWQAPDFGIYLQREEDNRHDPNAIQVMGRATIRGRLESYRLGYIERDTALFLAGIPELDARLHSVWLPVRNLHFSLRIIVLVRATPKKRSGPPPLPT